jgi:hypothetical protein
VGDSKLATRRARAVGTRDRILSHLAQTREIRDESGMASTTLARLIDYPGSSIAFAQLLAGMERAGLIRREVRGKRTYRISLAPGWPASTGPRHAAAALPGQTASDGSGSGPAAEASRSAGPARPGAGAEAAGGPLTADLSGFDYDELARRLLILLVRQLATAPGHAGSSAASPGNGLDAAGLEKTVAHLEQELATARTVQGTLTAENARLREQLRETRRRLALAQERRARPAITEQFDGGEMSLLERLLFGVADG